MKIMFFSLIGVCLLLFASVFSCIYSHSYLDKKDETYRELLSFLYTSKQKLSSSSAMLNSILTYTEEELIILEGVGFFKLAKESGLFSAFSSVAGKLLIENKDKKRLSDFFFDFGTNMLEAEIENITRCIADIESSYARVKNNIPDQKKVSSTVIICVTLLAIILII